MFKENDIEAFKELGNVGAGHSAIALTKLFKREVDMSVPFVRTGTIEKIIEDMGMAPDELVGYEKVSVDQSVKYDLSVVMRSSVVLNLIKLLSSTDKTEIKSEDDLTTMQKSLIQEVGSTIILRYIAAINKMMKVDTIPDTSPVFKFSSLKQAFEEFKLNEETVLIQLDLFTDQKKFESLIFIHPSPETIVEYRKAFHLG